MRGRFVALLRAIANTPMAPFREAMAELGFEGIASVGMSGNLIFTSPAGDVGALERQIGGRFDTVAMVRTEAEIARVADRYPFRNQAGASVMFLSAEPDATRVRELKRTAFEGDPVLLSGREILFRYPVLLSGRKTHANLERLVGVAGTARSISIVDQIRLRMRS